MQTAYSYVRFSHPNQRLGDSLRRQTVAAAAYAAEKGMRLDPSLKPDMAVSAFRGRNRKRGNLADFLKKIESGGVPKGSALLVESLDRLSREEIEESHNLLLSIARAGVEVHTISDGQVYRKGEMDVQKMIWSIFVLARSSEESKRKSERCASAAEQQRLAARKGNVITARVPGWLKAKKGGKIEVIPRHSTTVRRIFEMAASGIGSTRIVDLLNEGNAPTWTLSGRWSVSYIGLLLRCRHVLGEFQPGTHPRGGNWAPAGNPISDYFPRIVDDALWKRVQVARSQNFGRGKVPVGKYHGKGGRSNWKNLFLGILFDNDGDTMVYKRVQDNWVYLVSSDRKKFRTHKTRYEPFKQAVLAMLNDLDWKLLLKEARPVYDELQTKLIHATEQITETEKLRSRYLRVIEGDEEPDDSIVRKYKEAGKTLKDLAAQKQVLENRIGQMPALHLSKIPVLELTSDQQYHLILRDEIRKRVERIELTFNAEVIGGERVGIAPGAGKLLAKVLFINGAVKWAVIEGNRAVLLTLGGRFCGDELKRLPDS